MMMLSFNMVEHLFLNAYYQHKQGNKECFHVLDYLPMYWRGLFHKGWLEEEDSVQSALFYILILTLSLLLL